MGRPKGSKNIKKSTKVSVTCPTCGVTFYKFPSVVNKSNERGCLLYCSPECAKANRKNVWPLHGEQTNNWKDGRASYRQRAIKEHGLICNKCGYDGTDYPSLIWVHHEDFKPRKQQENHGLENLRVLCIRCHLEEHLAIQKLEAKTMDVQK